MKHIIFLAITTIVMLPFLSAQEEDSGWYAKAVGGFNDNGGVDLAWTNNGVTQQAEAAYEPSFTAGGALGYRWSPRFRMEGDLLYRSSEIEEVTFEQAGFYEEGNYASLTFSLNLLSEFNLFGSPKAKTYIGAGLAYIEEVDVDFERDGGEISFSSDELGYQVMAGVRYQLGKKWLLDAELRFLDAGDVTMDAEDSTLGTITGAYEPISLLFGLGYRF